MNSIERKPGKKSDDEYFENDPNAARFRDLAHTLLCEPGATKEDVRATLSGYGADDEMLDRIFRVKEGAEQPQKQQLQQQAQANAGESAAAGDAVEKAKQEALSQLIEERQKGNKGARILNQLKKLGIPAEEIDALDKSAGEPAKRARKVAIAAAGSPSSEAQASVIDQGNIDRVREILAEGKSPFDVLLAEGWAHEDIEKYIHEIHEQMQSQEGATTTEVADEVAPANPPASAGPMARSEKEKTAINSQTFWDTGEKIYQKWQAGASNEQITQELEKAGWDKKTLPRAFAAADMVLKRKTYEEAASVDAAYETPIFESVKRMHDPLFRFLVKLARMKENRFRVEEARLGYAMSRGPAGLKEDEIQWQSADNYHDFLRLCDGPLKDLHTRVTAGRTFIDRLKDPKDPLHAYQAEWDELRLSIRRSEMGNFPPDEYARAVARGEVPLADEYVIEKRKENVPEEQIAQDLKKAGWKESDVREIMFIADKRPLPEHFERPEFEMAKRYFDPVRRYLMTLSRDRKNNFRIKEALPRYGIGLAPEEEKEGAKVTWTAVTNFHDFLRRIWDMPEAERARLRTALFTERSFQSRMDDEKDPLHEYKKDWLKLIEQAVRPRSGSERLPDEYARHAWRGEVYLEVPEEAWGELSGNADALGDPMFGGPISAEAYEALSGAGSEVYDSDVLDASYVGGPDDDDAFRIEDEPADTTSLEDMVASVDAVDPLDDVPAADVHSDSGVEEPFSIDLSDFPPFDPAAAAIEPHIDPIAARIETEEQDAIDARIAAARGGAAIEQEIKSFDEAFDRLYPAEPGWLTTSAPDDVFDAYHQLKHRYRNATGDVEREAAVAELQAFLNAPGAIDIGAPSVSASRLSAEEERQRIIDTELQKFREYGEGYTPLEDGTPKEWKERLRSLISSAKEKVTPSGERAEKMRKYLAGRAEALGETAKKYGPGVEAFIRAKGEEYNKLSLTKKLLIGGVLGVGAAAFSTVSTPLATAFAINLGIQRVAGMSSMFLKIEKYLQDHKGKNIGMGPLRIQDEKIKGAAAFGAIAYTAFMGAAIGESVRVASESSYGQAVHEWLGRMLEHRPASISGISKDAPAPAPAPAASAPTSAASAAGAPQASEVSGVASIDVKATGGRGYEYMAKRLWEQLQEKNIKLPSGANPNSDLAKLLDANKDSIDTLVHQLAQKNEIFKDGGASARINLDSHMSIDTNGNISLSNIDTGKVTPPYHTEASTGGNSPEAIASAQAHFAEQARGTPHPALERYENFGPGDRASSVPAEGPAGIAGGTATEVTVNPESSGEDILIRTQEPAPVIEKSFVVNTFGLTVPLGEAHVYAGPTGENAVYAFGGDKKVRLEAIFDYLSAHPTATVIAADETEKYRAVWSMKDGKMTSSEPLKKTGFLGIFNTLMDPPHPGELAKLIK